MSLPATVIAAQLPAATAALISIAVFAASARMLWRHLRMPATRPRAWRLAALLVIQFAGAFLLYRTLFPPVAHAPAGLLVVATAGADRVTPMQPPGAQLVAMPEAPTLAGAVRMPDLATALRRHPGSTRVRVIGAGLVPRDVDAARGLALEFRPAPLPRGLVGLWQPPAPLVGRGFNVNGRVHDVAGGRVELLDPGNRVVARAVPGEDGRFRVTGIAHAAGPATWQLRLRDRAGRIVEDTPLPLDVAPGARLRVLVLAGAPDPELKYLRRWASDAGLALDSSIELGAGMQIGDASTRLDAGTLAEHDLVVLDARSWQTLGARRAPLLQAVRGGLGLLLRLPYATSPADRAALRRLGFATATGRAREILLPSTQAGAQAADAARITRGPLRVAGDTAVSLLPDAGGAPLAWWRAHGLGRIGVAGFDDSYRLVLAGDKGRHGELWATLFSTLARPRATPLPVVEGDARVGERVVLCGLPPAATVHAPDGRRIGLRVDPAAGTAACAGFWPRVAGWNALRTGDVLRRFHVRAAGEAPGLRAAQLRAATAQLVSAPPASTPDRRSAVPGPRRPWFLAWLAVAAAGWWFERSRLGRGAAAEG